MTDTQFRTWMTELKQPEGDRIARPEWLRLLQTVFEGQLREEQKIERTYAGQKILIPRHNHPYEATKAPEKRAVYGLYHNCLSEAAGLLSIEGEQYWLLSYEVPNQDSRARQRADLIGLSSTGGIVVFEAKLGENSYGPITSLLEGLDYLACLTCDTNYRRIQEEAPLLIAELARVPTGFEDVQPDRSKTCEVILLAPPEYYKKYSRAARGSGWRDLASANSEDKSIRFRLAVSDVDSDGSFNRDVQWCPGRSRRSNSAEKS